MRTPQKTMKIYEQLRRDILLHVYRCGERLPKEVDLSAQLHISRDTLRAALDMLERDSLIRRVRGFGTFVCDEIQCTKVCLLLPYAEKTISNLPFMSDVFQGILDGAMQWNCDVVATPVSPSNNPEDIDWERLFNLSAESRVIVCGTWFKKIFPFLLASKCRVALINDCLRSDVSHEAAYSRWHWLTKDTRQATSDMVEALASRGCRHPAFLMRYLDDSDSYLREDLLTFSRRFFPGVEPVFFAQRNSLPLASIEEGLSLVRSLLEGHEVDGVLVNDFYVYRALRKLAPDMLCGVYDLKQIGHVPMDDRLFYSEFPLHRLGHEALRMLLDPEAEGHCQKYEASIMNGIGDE